MAPTTEILIVTFQSLFGFWPWMVLGALESVVWGYRHPGQVFRRAVQNLVILWGFFAALRFGLYLAERRPADRFIAEPTGTILFLSIGLFLLAVQGLTSWKQQREARRTFLEVSSVEALASLSPRQFIRLVTDTYRTFGHQLVRMERQPDSVVDLTMSAPTGETWIIRCHPGGAQVDTPAVRTLYNLIHLENAHRGAYVTRGQFTPPAHQWALGKPVYLYDGNGFLAVLEQARRFDPAPRQPVLLAATGPWISANSQGSPGEVQRCPDCGGALVITQSAADGRHIYGCSNYPHCRVILPAD